MIIKCRKCGKEFDTASRRNQHEKDAHGYKAGKSPFKPAQQPTFKKYKSLALAGAEASAETKRFVEDNLMAQQPEQGSEK